MSSYAARKVRVFKECGDNAVVKKRSDGRMKAYPSATDARAWVTEREERRQHILDLVRGDSGKGMALGKYVPIEVLIDTLLANKNADIERLRQQIDELQQLLACYEKLDLTPEQRAQLEKLKGQIVASGGGMDRTARAGGQDFRSGAYSDGPAGASSKDGRGAGGSAAAAVGGVGAGAGGGAGGVGAGGGAGGVGAGGGAATGGGAAAGRRDDPSDRPDGGAGGVMGKFSGARDQDQGARAETGGVYGTKSLPAGAVGTSSGKSADDDAARAAAAKKEADDKAATFEASNRAALAAKETADKELAALREAEQNATDPEEKRRLMEAREAAERTAADKAAAAKSAEDSAAAARAASKQAAERDAEAAKLAAEKRKSDQEAAEKAAAAAKSADEKAASKKIADEKAAATAKAAEEKASAEKAAAAKLAEENAARLSEEKRNADAASKNAMEEQGPAAKLAAEKKRAEEEIAKREADAKGSAAKREADATASGAKLKAEQSASKEAAERENARTMAEENAAKVSAGKKLTDGKSGSGVPEDIDELQSMLKTCRAESAKQRDLARKAIEKLETLQEIIQERDRLKKKLEDSESELSKLRAERAAAPSVSEKGAIGGKGAGAKGQSAGAADKSKQADGKLRDQDSEYLGKVDYTTPSEKAGANASEKASGAKASEKASGAKASEKASGAKNRIQPPDEEIENLEKEIEQMRNSGELTPEQEVDIMRKELTVLKKYCDKLSNIQDENNQLQKERDILRDQLAKLRRGEGVADGKSDAAGALRDDMTGVAGISGKPDYQSQMALLDKKIAELAQITAERDRLKDSVTKLEKELANYSGLPEDVEIFKRKSKMMDDLLEERDSLTKRLSKMKGMEAELKELKKKADLVDELQRQLDALRKELDRLQGPTAGDGGRDGVRAGAKDKKNTEISDQELERLRYRVKEGDVLREERDRLKARLDELSGIEAEYLDLAKKMKAFDAILKERDLYKQKCAELEQLSCECGELRKQIQQAKKLDRERDAMQRRIVDCECVIADQENEINALVDHIDRLSSGNEDQQERVKQALGQMREELEQKGNLLAASEEQIAGVQRELQTTIKEVTTETESLHGQIRSLDNNLCYAQECITDKQKQIEFLNSQLGDKDKLLDSVNIERRSSLDMADKIKNRDGIIDSLKKEQAVLKAENARLQEIVEGMNSMVNNDDGLHQILHKSKQAVQRVSYELEQRYQNLDVLEEQMKQDETTMLSGCKKMQAQMRKLEEDLKKANETIAKLNEHVVNAERITAENKALKRHSSEIQEVAKVQIKDMAEKLKTDNDEIMALSAESASIKGEIGGLRIDNDALKKENEALKKENKALREENESLKEDNTHMKEENSVLKKENTKIKEFSSDHQAASSSQIGILKKDLGSLQTVNNENTELKKRMEDLQALLENERVKNVQLEKDMIAALADEKQKVEKLKEENTKLEGHSVQQKEVTGNENEILKKELENLQSVHNDNGALKKELEELQAQLENEKLKSGRLEKDMIAALADEKQKAANAESSKRQSIAEEIEKNNVFSKQLEDEANKMKALQDALENEIQNRKNAENEKELCLKNTEDKEAQLRDQANQIKELQNDHNDSIRKLQEAENAKGDYDKKVKDLEKELDMERDAKQNNSLNDQELIKSLQQKLVNESNKSEQLQNQNSDLQKQKDELGDLRAENEALKNVSKELDAIKQERDDLKTEVLTKKPTLTDDEYELNKVELEHERKEKQALQDMITDLENQLNNMQADSKGIKPQLTGDSDKLKAMERKLAEKQLQADAAERELNKLKANKTIAESDDEKNSLLYHEQALEQDRERKEDNQKVIDALNKKIAELQDENSRLRAELEKAKQASKDFNKSDLDLNKLQTEMDMKHKKAMERRRCECTSALSNMKSQYDRDIKNLHNKHNDNISKMQSTHEEIISISKRGLTQQVENLQKELETCKCDIDLMNRERKNVPRHLEAITAMSTTIQPVAKEEVDLTAQNIIVHADSDDDALNLIIEKCIECGMEGLAFEELQYMHSKVCDATARVLQRGSGAPLERKMLKKRIGTPKPINISDRQKEAQDLISRLQDEISVEKRKLRDLKDNLEKEKVTNIGLLSQIKAQSRAGNIIKAERQEVLRTKEEISKYTDSIRNENMRVRQLEADLEVERQNNKQLKHMLQAPDNSNNNSGLAVQGYRSDDQDAMRFELNKALTSDMILKMQMQQTSTRGPKTLQPQYQAISPKQTADGTKKGKVLTTTFYTELKVENINDQNKIHMSRVERSCQKRNCPCDPCAKPQ